MLKKSLNEFSIEELYRETKARDKRKDDDEKSTIPKNEELKEHSTKDIVKALVGHQRVIYGDDNRKEIGDAPDVAQNLARSVCAIFRKARVREKDSETSKLITRQYGKTYDLCTKERFFKQPIGAICTGFLIGKRHIATAGHYVSKIPESEVFLEELRIVFGYHMVGDSAVTEIKNSDIYSVTNIIKRVKDDDEGDWAILELDRDVTDREPLKLHAKDKINDKEELFVIGHPCGLPAKYADKANVRDNTGSWFFKANLDTYGSNSGSPVFNQKTNRVEGILVRGAKDFIWNGDCYVSNRCSDSGCSGETCTKITQIIKYIPKS